MSLKHKSGSGRRKNSEFKLLSSALASSPPGSQTNRPTAPDTLDDSLQDDPQRATPHPRALGLLLLPSIILLKPPLPFPARCQLGVVHFATGEYERARERFGKVLSIVEGLSSQVRGLM